MRAVWLLILAFALASCSNDSVSGTATDTENTVAGVVSTSSGSLASGASVYMVANRASYSDSLVYYSTTADDSGKFQFDSLVADTFNLDIRYEAEGDTEVALCTGLTAKAVDSVAVELSKPGYLAGVLDFYENLPYITVGSGFKFNVLGSAVSTNVLAGDSFVIAVAPGTVEFAFAPSDDFIVESLSSAGVPDSLIYQGATVEVAAGDTLSLGSFYWSLKMSQIDGYVWPEDYVLTGYVFDEAGAAVAGASVRLITDIFGYDWAMGGNATLYEEYAYSDSTGYYELPFPSYIPADSFRVEAEANSLIGNSNYLKTKNLESATSNLAFDTIWVDEPSAVSGNVNLVINVDDTTQTSDCLMNGIVVGIVGTGAFQKVTTCDSFELTNIPAGDQLLVYYTSDQTVLAVLEDYDVEDYMTFVTVGLAAGDTLEPQGITYTPPSL